MAIPFPSDEWVEAYKESINSSEAYAEAAKKWEGDFYFYIEPGGTLEETVILYLDLWHGKCREAFVAKDESVKSPAFLIRGSVDKWKKVILKQLDPIQGMMTGQLKLKGNMSMIMKNVKAAKELVECCSLVDTEFPV